MKRIAMTALAVLFAFATLASAQEADMKLANEMSKAVGIETMLAQIKQRTDVAVDQQMSQMMEQMRRQIPELPAEYVAEMDKLVAEYVVKIKDAWTAAGANEVYAKALAELLPEAQMKAAIEHYKTEQGQAELKAINEASMRLNDYITTSYQKVSANEIQEFMGKMRAIALKGKTAPRPPAEKEGEKK